MRATLLALALAACGGPALQSVKLTNGTPRAIAEVFVYPLGAANHGTSRGSLAPNATLLVHVPGGNVEVEAVSATIELDNHQREHRRASSAIELTGPAEVVFFDQGAKPALPPKAIGVEFVPGPPAN
jgi:hypothetical protein